MEKLDRIDWELFRLQVTDKLSENQFELLCQLHAKYFNHRYYKPCTCNPKTIVHWIKQLNEIYDANRKDQ